MPVGLSELARVNCDVMSSWAVGIVTNLV